MNQQTIEIVYEDFLSDRMARCTPRTVTNYYAPTLLVFVTWCERRGLTQVDQITAADLRAWVAELQDTHNPGGVHGYYRAARAFLNWYEMEYAPEWRNPARHWRVRSGNSTPLPGVTIENVMEMVRRASPRDKTILLFLLETGLRATEFIALNVMDYEPREGAVHVTHGKGDRTRTVYLGRQTRLMVQRYLRTRDYTGEDPLFVTEDGTRFTFWGLRQVVRRNAEKIGISPGLHDFRRCCALNLIRNGMSLAHVSLWLGHQSVGVTMRYLNLGRDDLRIAQAKASPVDRWYGK